MKYLFTALVFGFMLLAGDAFCEEAKAGPNKEGVAKQDHMCPVCGLKHIVTAEDKAVPEDPYYGVNETNENPERYDSYDENTGLPDVVPSDSEWYHGG